MKQPKILFFIDGPVPTDAERLEAFDLQAQVAFRNAQHVTRVDEECDGVAGAVPEAYADFPDAEEALAAYKAELAAQRDKLAEVGGEAPKSGKRARNRGGKTGQPKPEQTGQEGPQGGQGSENGGQGGQPQGDDDEAAKAALLAAGGGVPGTGGAGGWGQQNG